MANAHAIRCLDSRYVRCACGWERTLPEDRMHLSFTPRYDWLLDKYNEHAARSSK